MTGRSLRRAELAAHAASVVAVALTLVVVGADYAQEANPASAWVIDTAGLGVWALATPLCVGAIYAALRWWARHDTWPPARPIAWAVPAVLALDALGNVVALGLVGWPETIAPATVEEIAAVAVLAAAVAFRGHVRIAARSLVPRVQPADRPVVVAIVALVVLSGVLAGVPASVFGPGAPAETVDRAAAAGSVIDDFNDGNFDDDWSGDGGGSINAFETQTATVKEGTHAAQFDASDASVELNDVTTPLDSNDPSTFSFYLNYNGFSSNDNLVFALDNGNTNSRSFELSGFSSSGEIVIHESGSDTNTNTQIQADAWYEFAVTNIDYGADTYQLTVTNASGTVILDDSFSFGDSTGGATRVFVEGDTAVTGFQFDYLTQGGKEITQTVSGYVKDVDGNAVDAADIDAYNSSNSLDAETTTNNSGYYSVNLSDDDYTIQATNGSDTGTTDVTVSGSDVTDVNITIGASDLYLKSASPQHDHDYEWYDGGGDVPFTVRPIDEQGRNITVTLQVKEGGTFTDHGSTEVENDTVATINYLPDPYRHRWRVELNTSDGRSSLSPDFGVNVPGYIKAINGSSGARVDDTTSILNFTTYDTADATQFNSSDPNGVIPLEGVTDADDDDYEVWTGPVSANGYNDTRSGFIVPENSSYVIYPENATGLYDQCFTLTDESGAYPPAESWLETQTFVGGTWYTANSALFGADNEANVQMEDGQDYRLLVHNSKGDVRGVGAFEGDTNRSGECVELVIGDSIIGVDKGGAGDDGEGLYSFDGSWNETSTGAVLRAELNTVDNFTLYNTTLLFYEFQNKSNVSFAPVQLGTVSSTSYKRPLNESWANKTWVIELEAEDPDDNPVNARVIVGRDQRTVTDLGPVAPPPWLLQYGSMMLLVLLAGAFSQRNVAMGGLVVPAFAGMFFFIGWWDGVVALTAVAGTLALGAVYYLADQMEGP